MKTLFIAAATAAAVLAMPAQAQTQTAAGFTVTGTVAAACNYTGGAIAFTAITTDTNGNLSANQSATSAGQNFYCNGAGTTIDVAHVALANTVQPATGFTSTLDFTPTVSVGSTTLATGDVMGTATGAKTGTLTVSAALQVPALKPMAGSYSGSIAITFHPTI